MQAMRLTDIAEVTVSHLFGRLVRRALGSRCSGLLAIVDILLCQPAGMVALAMSNRHALRLPDHGGDLCRGRG